MDDWSTSGSWLTDLAPGGQTAQQPYVVAPSQQQYAVTPAQHAGHGQWAPQPVGPPPGPSGGGNGLKIIAGVLGVGMLAVLLVGWMIWQSVTGVTSQLPFDELQAGQSYGDNPELDVLWDRCEAGQFDACDTLYFVSEFDSEYEAFGDTCGHRNEPGGLCATMYSAE